MSKTQTPQTVKPRSKSDQSTTDFVTDFMMGGIAAAISKTIASPIEVIKMRL